MALTNSDLSAIKGVVGESIKEADLATKAYVDQGFSKMEELIGSVEKNLTKEIREVKKVVDVHSIEIMQLKAK